MPQRAETNQCRNGIVLCYLRTMHICTEEINCFNEGTSKWLKNMWKKMLWYLELRSFHIVLLPWMITGIVIARNMKTSVVYSCVYIMHTRVYNTYIVVNIHKYTHIIWRVPGYNNVMRVGIKLLKVPRRRVRFRIVLTKAHTVGTARYIIMVICSDE